MTKRQRKTIIKKQIREMIKDFEIKCLQAAERVIDHSSMIDPEFIDTVAEDNYLLAKAVLHARMSDLPYRPLDRRLSNQFSQVYMSI